MQGIAWNPLGQPTGWSWSLPGGAASIPATRSYNSAGQLTATEMGSYQYDAAGRIHTARQKLWRPANTNPQAATLSQATSTWSAGYDSAGRLESLTKTTAANAPPDSTSFQYDANGNLLGSQRERAGTSTTRSYSTEASHNKLLGLEQTIASSTGSTSASTTYQYDSTGSLQTDGLYQYHYDSQGRLQSASTGQGVDAPTTRYAHNALGQRVFKTEALYGTSSSALDEDEEDLGLLQSIQQFFTRLWSPKASDAEHLGWSYLYDENASLLGDYGMGGANSGGQGQYFYLPTASGPMPIAAEIDGRIYAIHSDHLNTPRRLTQPDGQTAWQWAYSAYGDEAPTLGAKRFTDATTTPTVGATSIPPVRFNLRYPGQTFDEETGLHYNYFRSYDPKTGRYTQGDPIGLEGGWNRFGYVGGNALSFTDPFGLAPNQMCVAACTAGGAVVGGVVGEIAGGVVGGVIGGAGGSLVGPVGAGGGAAAGAAAGSQAGGVTGAAGGAAAGNAAGQLLCPDDSDCSPPAGTKCYEGPDTTHSHAGLNPHYHIFQMFKFNGQCQWKYLGGKVGKGVLEAPPLGMSSCSAYSGFQGR